MARILLIDDDDALRTPLGNALIAEGHEVSGAASGPEGVAIFRAKAFDLVLIDMFMPGGGGLDRILDLRRLDPSALILAMTDGGPSVDLLDTVSELGADRTLMKPFQVSEAVALIRQMLKAKRAA